MSRDDVRKRLFDLNPDQLESYLIATGWRCDDQLGTLASIWHRSETNHQDAEILLPLQPASKDFRERLVDAIFSIASFEKRQPIEIARIATEYFSDRVGVRVLHHDVEGGTIPLSDGVLLNQRAHDLMVAGALSTFAKRRHFSGARTPEAADYIDSLRLGQTEIGSYVVNVIAPLQSVQTDQESFAAIPIARLVTATLISSLEALGRAADQYANTADLTVFDEAVAQGASANLCEALLGLSGEKRGRSFEISIVPSRNESQHQEARTFTFDTQKVSHIAAAAEYYKDNYVLTNRTIDGFVKRLDRPRADENGTITIETTLGDIEKNVAIELGPDDYLNALAAHKAKDIVECTGDVHVTARTAKLLNPSGFRVRKSGDLFQNDGSQGQI